MTIGSFKMAARIMLVYFSSRSNNTHRFVQKLDAKALRIPISGEPLLVNEDYILIVPTYAAGGSDSKGAVPKQVIHFLNKANNRRHCKGLFPLAIPTLVIPLPLQDPLLPKNCRCRFCTNLNCWGHKEMSSRCRRF